MTKAAGRYSLQAEKIPVIRETAHRWLSLCVERPHRHLLDAIGPEATGSSGQSSVCAPIATQERIGSLRPAYAGTPSQAGKGRGSPLNILQHQRVAAGRAGKIGVTGE